MYKITQLNIEDDLKEQYIAFIDVLGFSNLVSHNQLDKIDSYFRIIVEELDLLRSTNVRIDSLLISDSIILIAPDSFQGLKELIVATRNIQSGLLGAKILMRGAVSFGEVYYNKDERILFGKGFIKAYNLEKEEIYPRVIIEPSIIKKVAKDKTEFMQLFNGDLNYNFEKQVIYNRKESKLKDDGIFIDYASDIIRKDSFKKDINKVFETIIENLYGEQRLYAKYAWFRDYFLETLNQTWAELFDINNSLNWSLHQKNIKDWKDKFERL